MDSILENTLKITPKNSHLARRRTQANRTPERIPGDSILLKDTSFSRVSASILDRGTSRDPRREAHLAHLFLDRNQKVLHRFDIDARVDFDGAGVYLAFNSGSIVGAFPLVSPVSGKRDISLIVHPRFGWSGVGVSLSKSGFKIVPRILPLGLLPKTDREIPAWVLSAAILPRLERMLQRMRRSFEMVSECKSAPSGGVEWSKYATEMVPRLRLLEVPCRHPDLVEDRELKAAVHFTLRKQLSSLETQRNAGAIVFELIQLCTTLMRLVVDVAPRPPSPRRLEGWWRTPLIDEHFSEGLNAISWTINDTGLGGTTDWRGLSWAMSMEQFYEAWVETALEQYARRFGGVLKSGRRRETITPIAWERPYLGSQKYLLPDLVIEQENRTIYVDAKYKSHWEELQKNRWLDLESQIQQHHREDLLQVLAYSTLSGSNSTTACITYPCTPETWTSLKNRGILSRRGAIYAGERRIDLILTAVPMGSVLEEVIDQLGNALALN